MILESSFNIWRAKTLAYGTIACFSPYASLSRRVHRRCCSSSIQVRIYTCFPFFNMFFLIVWYFLFLENSLKALVVVSWLWTVSVMWFLIMYKILGLYLIDSGKALRILDPWPTLVINEALETISSCSDVLSGVSIFPEYFWRCSSSFYLTVFVSRPSSILIDFDVLKEEKSLYGAAGKLRINWEWVCQRWNGSIFETISYDIDNVVFNIFILTTTTSGWTSLLRAWLTRFKDIWLRFARQPDPVQPGHLETTFCMYFPWTRSIVHSLLVFLHIISTFDYENRWIFFTILISFHFVLFYINHLIVDSLCGIISIHVP